MLRFAWVSLTAGLLLAPLPAGADDKEDPARAVAKVKEAGGSVEVDPDLSGKPVVAVTLTGKKVNDNTLKSLAAFTKLKKLNLAKSKITDDGLDAIAGLAQLEALDLSNTEITDAGLDKLKEYERLEELHLDDTEITNKSLENIKRFKRLKILTLGNTAVDDKGMAGLKPLAPSFVVLDLRGTGVGDAGMDNLGRCFALEKLHLNGTKVTDKCVDHLVNCERLKEVYFNVTKVSEDGAKKLQKALPKTKIVR